MIYAQGAGGSPDQAGIFRVVGKGGNTITLLRICPRNAPFARGTRRKEKVS